MIFPVNSDRLNGIIRSYVDRKSPIIELMPSSTYYTYYVENILDYNNTESHWVSNTDEGLNGSLVVKITDDPFLITHYSIRSHHTDYDYVRAWTFEGSNDNIKYELLHNKTDNSELANSSIGQYEVNPRKKGFRYFRIKQTIETHHGWKDMRISGLDFFGIYPYTRKVTCNNVKNSDLMGKLFFIFVVLY